MSKHGHARGRKPSITYISWQGMKRRCDEVQRHRYEDYGGRGIQYDPRWKDFATFLDDMGPRPSRRHQLDRIDNDGNYCKENCRWATAKAQAKNKRPPRCKIKINGHYIRDYARAWQCSYCAAWQRIVRAKAKGRPVAPLQAVVTPGHGRCLRLSAVVELESQYGRTRTSSTTTRSSMTRRSTVKLG